MVCVIFCRRYSRLIPGKYGDNRYTIALAKSGRALPNARLLSMHMHSGNSEPDTQFTLINMQHGQVIAHDLSLKAGAMASRKTVHTIHTHTHVKPNYF